MESKITSASPAQNPTNLVKLIKPPVQSINGRRKTKRLNQCLTIISGIMTILIQILILTNQDLILKKILQVIVPLVVVILLARMKRRIRGMKAPRTILTMKMKGKRIIRLEVIIV